ncbi:peptide chain release factor N(5)-glutamine methyltransferase [Dethiosulfatarculus sandiegensis]|uniref:Release factor glutamine methyltransferase n=1 Tax=Dethiosulfatarculus sandiegensis TaxID=1429043 RepID=A0A0D2JCN3_9BACT|nr:peptide chain release factor N(5)-glutamine methyltransferase [Dethiosulfatarculus sandiegensis]KIX15904.1 methyltransferase [Dethiosulfatarculus sandiegensis]
MTTNSKPQSWTITGLTSWATDYLAKYKVESPRLSAELMLAKVLNCQRVDLYLRFDQPLTEAELAGFKALLLRRRIHEPMAYILGQREFYGLEFKVGPGVLIPRPETEHLVEKALECLEGVPAPQILDLCTGSGAVALALASEVENATVLGVDLSPEALEYAQLNAGEFGFTDRVSFLKGDLFQPVDPGQGFFELITANPPYVSEREWQELSPQVRDYEPRLALAAERHGLAVIERIIKGAATFLRPQGWLLIEMGQGQAEKALALCRTSGAYESSETVNDLAGIPRVLACQRKDYG